MRNNIVTAVAGDLLYIKTDPVFQYDQGLVLMISGVALPNDFEIHFSNDGDEIVTTTLGNSEGTNIPNAYLMNGKDIHAWLYMHTGENDGESVYHIHIPVISRPAIPPDI